MYNPYSNQNIIAPDDYYEMKENLRECVDEIARLKKLVERKNKKRKNKIVIDNGDSVK